MTLSSFFGGLVFAMICFVAIFFASAAHLTIGGFAALVRRHLEEVVACCTDWIAGLRRRRVMRWVVSAVIAVPLVGIGVFGLWTNLTLEVLWVVLMIYGSMVALNFGVIAISFALFPDETDLDRMFNWLGEKSRIE